MDKIDKPKGATFNINNGDVVFFKKAKKSTSRKAPEATFKGYGFGVMLGHVPPFAAEPPPQHLLRLMGTVGFLTFDDVAEFVGDENAKECVKKFEDKYYGKEAQDAAPEVSTAPTDSSGLDGAVAEPPRLVAVDGSPLQSSLPPKKEEQDEATH